MPPTPYLFFNGNCAEAIETYAAILGGTIKDEMKASDMPGDQKVPDAKKDWLVHCELQFEGGSLMAGDDVFEPAGHMAGCGLAISLPTFEAAETAFNQLAEGGTVSMPFGPTFFAAGFGRLIDRFGVCWMVNVDAD